jgi:hypothetical protein
MIKLESKPNIELPSATYEYGSIKDTAGATLGTPVSREVYSDIHQLLERFMELSQIVPNDLPDNTVNGYQLSQAFAKIANGSSGIAVYRISQTGASVPVITLLSTIIPIEGLVATRLGVGEYNITITGSLTFFSEDPFSLLLTASNGSALAPANASINCRMVNNGIKISTAISGVPADNVLNRYVFELRLFAPDAF